MDLFSTFRRLAFLALLLGTVLAKDCVHRDFHKGGTVCVCNATYCDDFPALHKTGRGVATAYITSNSGLRFKKTELHFSANQNSHSAGVHVNLEHTERHQSIIGFGGAFTDSAGINIKHLSPQLQDRLIRDYFASDGLEYSLGRIPIGGSDFSTRPYTYHEVADDYELKHFALAKDDFDYKIPIIKAAEKVAVHPIKLYGSPWSGPKWIKTNHEVQHGGFIIGAPGGKYYKVFALYLLKFLQEYQKNGVNIWGITVENEPRAGWQSNYEFNSLGFNGTLERDFVKMDLGPLLHQHGYTNDKLKVMIFDDTIDGMDKFVDTVLQDHEAAKYVSGIALHWYIPSDRSETGRLHQRYPNYFILWTEASELSHPELGSWQRGSKYVDDIIKCLNNYATGWTDWNLVLDPMGQPRWNQPVYGLDSPVIVSDDHKEYYKQPMFYAMGHFSKFLVPGSVRLGGAVTSNDPKNVDLTVFERPDGGVVLVVQNRNKHQVVVQVHDPHRGGWLDVHLDGESFQSVIWY